MAPAFLSARAYLALAALAALLPACSRQGTGARAGSDSAELERSPAVAGASTGAVFTPADTGARGAAAAARAPAAPLDTPRRTAPPPTADGRPTPLVRTPAPPALTAPSSAQSPQPSQSEEPAPNAAPAAAPQPAAPTPAPARAALPFAVGERLSYEVRFGSVKVGNATLALTGTEEIRGHPALHAVFTISGGTLFLKVNDHYESWFDTTGATIRSLRYVQDIDEGPYERNRHYEIFPDRGTYQEPNKPEQPSVADPLDDASFIYFLRTIPLEVGKSYSFDRYFRPDRNPVTVRVVRREQVKVPAGTFDAFVVQPIIKSKGIFGEGGHAEVWLAADSTRRVLQIRAKVKFGTLGLAMK